MGSPLVTIIVPLFNKEKYILATLRSISGQTYKNWECIVSDDGSSDNSLLLVEQFISATPGRWKIVSQINSGPSSARNRGIKSAKGEYIAFVDADDIWLQSKLQIQVEYLEKNPDVSMLLSNYIIFNDSSLSELRGIRAKNVLVQTRRWLDMRGFGGLVESTGILRASSLADDLVFDSTLITAEGLDFVIRWNLEKCVQILPNFLTLYRISDNQLHNNVELTKTNMLTLVDRYSQELNVGEKALLRQDAYFALANMREWPKLKIVSQMLHNLLARNFEVFFMAVWIIGRNLRAKFLSRNTKKVAKEHLLRLNV
jgi:glycosyltransferase involved in cell wall biosynthesis